MHFQANFEIFHAIDSYSPLISWTDILGSATEYTYFGNM